MIHRCCIAMAATILCFEFGISGRAAAGIVLPTPAGLKPGDHFRFAFVTDQALQVVLSSNILDYDNFVQSQAGGATYNGAEVSWLAIASTPNAGAIQHVGITTDPVFLADGTLVADTTSLTGLWSGSLLHPLDEDLTGTILQKLVLTGTLADGSSGDTLGSTNSANAGFTSSSTSSWINGTEISGASATSFYGISQDLVVSQASVPEPTSLILMATSIGAVVVASRHRSAQDPRRR